jgi:hypothetical protein
MKQRKKTLKQYMLWFRERMVKCVEWCWRLATKELEDCIEPVTIVLLATQKHLRVTQYCQSDVPPSQGVLKVSELLVEYNESSPRSPHGPIVSAIKPRLWTQSSTILHFVPAV